MRTPLARLPSVVGSTSWGLRWNFRPHSRGAAACAATACTSIVFSPGFSRAVLIISSVSRFLGLGASRKRELQDRNLSKSPSGGGMEPRSRQGSFSGMWVSIWSLSCQWESDASEMTNYKSK